ncbi:flagellar hook-length control protein FliK [Paenibacillus sedimenti]|uniref:Flagellar hook-length control protein FliK n=1 Tax=Paenibacillus sedimenti TaxID=2770274 RepID=A0A926KQH2_9BACL|nr:flagellar hook-length control protein FliK [Paenibacillus sedimenti]MBD0380354.1 flagellar hook-length control protein FliK [Paenibacillus sedimenti]
MDVQLPIGPSSSTQSPSGTASTSTVTGKAKATVETQDSFNQLLSGQLGQTSTDAADTSDEAASLAALLQMLQSLTMPMQSALQNEPLNTDESSETQTLPEMLLQVMNTNAGLAEQLLQDPRMKQWFEQAEQLLSSLSDSQSTPAFSLIRGSSLQPAHTMNLQAQNTLLTLASLTKQQPDNPILQYLNQDLQNAIEPLLPQLKAGSNASIAVKEQTAKVSQESAGSEEAGLSEVHPASLRTLHKRTYEPAAEQMQTSNSATVIQPTLSKLEMLAVKNAMNVPAIQSIMSTEVPIEPDQALPTEVSGISNPMTTLTDLQKAQLASTPLEKPVAQTMNASNFSEEMTEHVLKSMKITLADGISEAKISLFPKNLGHIDVKITMHEGQLVAQFAADTLAGKQMLESQLSQLRQSLQTQGLQVEKLEVTQSANMQSSMFQDQRQGQFSNQSQRQNKNRSVDYDADSSDFNQGIENVVQPRSGVYGNSFDVIA